MGQRKSQPNRFRSDFVIGTIPFSKTSVVSYVSSKPIDPTTLIVGRWYFHSTSFGESLKNNATDNYQCLYSLPSNREWATFYSRWSGNFFPGSCTSTVAEPIFQARIETARRNSQAKIPASWGHVSRNSTCGRAVWEINVWQFFLVDICPHW